MIVPVILSGGSGTRLWPRSRKKYPKQLIALQGEYSLLQSTIMRLEHIANVAPPVIVCNEKHRFIIAEQLRQIGVKENNIILEPEGRNTAAALTAAAFTCESKSVLFVMPADHLIDSNRKFNEAVLEAYKLSENGRIAVFGIKPVRAETGYGYIKAGDGNRVISFVEKPSQDKARSYVDSGDYLWNSGMFMMQAGVWLNEISKFSSEIFSSVKESVTRGKKDADFFRLEKSSFLKCPDISIDYAVMEKTDLASVIPLNADWSDIGSWFTLWEMSKKDNSGNVSAGDVYTVDTRDSYILSTSRLVTTLGINNMVVVETQDAVLVADLADSQNVRKIVNILESQKRGEVIEHRRVERPWGHYEILDEGIGYKVKHICLKPGASISLQRHKHRAEHWVVVEGIATVTRDNDVFDMSQNGSTFIPIGAVHRLENNENNELRIIEVQSGDYLGEDDIERFQDQYNRIS